jgi:hypothetical protein
MAACATRQETAAGELERLQGDVERLEGELLRQEEHVAEARRLRDRAVESASSTEADPDQAADEAAVLQESLAELQKQRGQLATRFTPSHPVVQDVDRRIAEVAGMLEKVRSTVRVAPESPQGTSDRETDEALHTAEQKLQALRQELQAVRATQDKQMLVLAELQEETELERRAVEEAAAELARLETLTEQIHEQVPVPAAQDRVGPFGLLFSLALACLFGCVAFTKAKPANRWISGRSEVESILALPLIGLLPGTDDSPIPAPLPDPRPARGIRRAAELTLVIFAAATVAAVGMVEGYSQRLADQPLSATADGVRVILEYVLRGGLTL